jgi:small subunit ribosomal protein S8
MSQDLIGDFLTVIRNGIMRSKDFVELPHSNVRFELAKILKEEGFINNIAIIEDDSVKRNLKLFLRYVGGESAIHEIKRESRPGRRLYTRTHELKPVIGGLGVSILTTSRGFMTNKKAKELQVGGEIICTVW